MNTKSMMCARLLAVLTICLLLLPVAVRAEGEDEPPAVETQRYEIRKTRPQPVVVGSALPLPTDGTEEGTWLGVLLGYGESTLSFGEDEEPGYAPSADDLINLLWRSVLYDDEYSNNMSAEEDGDFHVRYTGPAAALRQARRGVDWLVEACDPVLPVRATLLREGEDPALLTAGAARLQPGAWTGVYRQRRTMPLAVEWEIEIAQESTAMHPVIAQVPEGEELYLRYHPGESVAVIEMWTGALAHLRVFDVDLSGIRNIPEAGGPGLLQLPETAGYRTYTAFAVPSGQPVRREFHWSGPAGPVRLVLDLEPPAPSPIPEPQRDRHFRALRAGAVGSGLAFGRREDLTEQFKSRFIRPYEGEGRFSILTPGFVSFEGEADGAAWLDTLLQEAERRLVTHHLGIRLLAVAEEPARRALAAGTLRPGHVLPRDVLVAISEEGGSSTGESVQLHVLDGIDASFRAGRSVLGLTRLDVEVAQQAGGSDPHVGAHFDGLSGEASVRGTRDGTLLDLHARVDYASAQAGKVRLVHRPPVGMGSGRDVFPPPREVDEIELPVLGGDSAVVAGTALLPPGGEEVLVDVVVHGGEVILVLARLVP